jgi:hypothetical protein
MSSKKLATKSYNQFLLGDPSAGISVAAGASIVCGAIDLNDVDLSAATIVLERVSGTGTLKCSGSISVDGITTSFAIGDLITAVTTASKAYKLSDAGFVYGRYLTITVTETGGSAAAVGRCVFMGQGK